MISMQALYTCKFIKNIFQEKILDTKGLSTGFSWCKKKFIFHICDLNTDALLLVHNMLVYVIVWVAVVFGINFASNAGRKLVIVRGEHYYCFLPALPKQLIQNTTATCTVTN